MIKDMIEKGYRAYKIPSSFYKRNIDMIQKKLQLHIVIGGDNLIFAKTIIDKNKR